MIIVDGNALQAAISTLKTLDVRGFDSMDKLVGVVMLLSRTLNESRRYEEPPVEEKEDGTE